LTVRTPGVVPVTSQRTAFMARGRFALSGKSRKEKKGKKDRRVKETKLTQGDQSETPSTAKPQKLSSKIFNA
jgi:hypothetical protein